MFKISLFVIVFSFGAQALDLSEYKENIRSPLEKILGEDIANKVLGAKQIKSSVELPNIPKVEVDATSVDVYKKKTIDSQGKQYRSLSDEQKRKYRIAFIQELYKVTRSAEAKTSDVLKFLNVLEQGGSREGVYRSITLDNVYKNLESFEEGVEKDLSLFVSDFGAKFLARQFDRNAIERLNLWSVKRIVVEKTLELMDVLASNPNDLHAWYAVLSSDLAQKYPQIWKSKVRQSQSDEFHLNWAKKAPFQHIKSETIIKLHEVMNFLNQASL
ncbi:MAG: hypothetical protein KC478_03490 [Bacteriovoracaceae bacterium]|nr:hypothetical protein [Bacteriovoracaceae bacterium]